MVYTDENNLDKNMSVGSTINKWNKPTLGNMDTNKSERKVDSYSSVMMQSIEENSLAAKFPSVFS
jgi:hypothetical protein